MRPLLDTGRPQAGRVNVNERGRSRWTLGSEPRMPKQKEQDEHKIPQ